MDPKALKLEQIANDFRHQAARIAKTEDLERMEVAWAMFGAAIEMAIELDERPALDLMLESAYRDFHTMMGGHAA